MKKNPSADAHLLKALNMANGFSDKVLQKQQAEEVKKALDEGANPNLYLPIGDKVTGSQYKNILYDTVHGGTPEVVELLLQYGADPNAVYYFKYDWSPVKRISSALHFAVQDRGAGIVRALLLAGANVHLKDHTGKTPMDLAKKADYKKMLSLAAAGKLKADTRVAPAKRSPVPKTLADFLAKEAPRYKGQGIPDFIAEGGTTKVKFLKKPSEAVFRDRDVDPLTCPDYHVLAELAGEEHFLVVDGKKAELPVLRWESETEEFERVDPSLKAFLRRLKR